MSPVKNMSRTVTTDVELRGQHLREGDQVMLFYPSANRDEDVFDRRRRASTSGATPTRTWPSASGPTSASAPRWPASSCKVMFREVLPRLPDLELARRRGPAVPAVELRQRPRGDAGAVHADARHGAVHRMTGPLDGVRVVELGVWVAGPGAAGILADWGADVVKIEPPAGDPARSFQRMLGGDLDVNPVFELDNRGKRSIVLDLSTERGVEIAHELLAGADVFLTNVRPAALDRLGLGPDDAARAPPPRSSTPSSPATGSTGPTPTGRPTTSPPSGPGPASPSRCGRPAARCRSSAAAWATTRPP